MSNGSCQGNGEILSLEERYGPLPNHSDLLAPFIYFGGKRPIAPMVWKRFGDVRSYVEPFAGSLAVLLDRPQPFDGPETVNDLDGLISNFWRSVQADPDAVAHYADWPVFENDLHARHVWLIERKESLQACLEGNPDYFDAKIAGWWVWGISCWIGGEWCSNDGPWRIVDGQFVKTTDAGQGVSRRRVQLSDEGRGVNRLSTAGNECRDGLLRIIKQLSDRLRSVRVCCGDWTRICGGKSGNSIYHMIQKIPCGVFLDPPYSDLAIRDPRCYRIDDLKIAHNVREWAIRYGDDDRFRIALCGYESEHVMPDSWECVEWKTQGGMSCLSKGKESQGKKNATSERIWFSPHCIRKPRLYQKSFIDD